MKKIPALFFVILVAFQPIFSQQDNEKYREQVRTQLVIVELALLGDNYKKAFDYVIDGMNDGYSESYTVTLQSGYQYKIVSVCDEDCGDVDMWIYDENNREIDSDVRSDDMPICDVSPKWTGKFTIKVKMYDCDSNPCYYGIGIYRK